MPFIKFFKLSRDDTPAFIQYYRSKGDPQVCGHPDKHVDGNTRPHFFAEYKVMTSMKNGFVSRFVKSGSMKAVFTNYSYIIYYIFIVFDDFPLKLTLISPADNLPFDKALL